MGRLDGLPLLPGGGPNEMGGRAIQDIGKADMFRDQRARAALPNLHQLPIGPPGQNKCENLFAGLPDDAMGHMAPYLIFVRLFPQYLHPSRAIEKYDVLCKTLTEANAASHEGGGAEDDPTKPARNALKRIFSNTPIVKSFKNLNLDHICRTLLEAIFLAYGWCKSNWLHIVQNKATVSIISNDGNIHHIDLSDPKNELASASIAIGVNADTINAFKSLLQPNHSERVVSTPKMQRHLLTLHAALYVRKKDVVSCYSNQGMDNVLIRLNVEDYKIQVELKYINLSHEIGLEWLNLKELGLDSSVEWINIDVALWNPKRVVITRRLFDFWKSFQGSGVEKWELPELREASYMFSKCKKFNPVTIASWLPKKLRSADNMFSECSIFQGIGVANWELPALQEAYRMFADCKEFNPETIKMWLPKNLINANYMFSNCNKFKGIGVDNWSLPNLTLAVAMFKGCKQLDFSQFSVAKWCPNELRVANAMFKDCILFTGNGIDAWNLSKLEHASSMFESCTKFEGNGIDCWTLHCLQDATAMFSKCSTFRPSSVSNWRPANLFIADNMFSECTAFTGKGIEEWSLPTLQSALNMFGGDIRFNPKSVHNWSLVSLIDARFMFRNCEIFTGKGAKFWELKELQTAENMFSGCSVFNANVAAWCPENLINAIQMFDKCRAFEGNGLADWGGCLTHLKSVKSMFSGCENLKLKNLATWELPEVKYNDLADMLENVRVNDDADIGALISMKLRVRDLETNDDVIRHIFGDDYGETLLRLEKYKRGLETACDNWRKYGKKFGDI